MLCIIFLWHFSFIHYSTWNNSEINLEAAVLGSWHYEIIVEKIIISLCCDAANIISFGDPVYIIYENGELEIITQLDYKINFYSLLTDIGAKLPKICLQVSYMLHTWCCIGGDIHANIMSDADEL